MDLGLCQNIVSFQTTVDSWSAYCSKSHYVAVSFPPSVPPILPSFLFTKMNGGVIYFLAGALWMSL